MSASGKVRQWSKWWREFSRASPKPLCDGGKKQLTKGSAVRRHVGLLFRPKVSWHWSPGAVFIVRVSPLLRWQREMPWNISRLNYCCNSSSTADFNRHNRLMPRLFCTFNVRKIVMHVIFYFFFLNKKHLYTVNTWLFGTVLSTGYNGFCLLGKICRSQLKRNKSLL